MKKKVLCALMVLLIFFTGNVVAQSYQSLWNQVNEAEQKDLPQTQLKVLAQIVEKAGKEGAYGHLLKGLLTEVRVQAVVSADSLKPAVERLEARAKQMKEVPLQAVYNAVLGKVYQNNNQLSDDWQALSDDYFRKAIAHPAELAAVKVEDYEPLVVKGEDSRFYGNDLLSLIGHETGKYGPMHNYYLTTSNRSAQLLSGLDLLMTEQPEGREKLEESKYIQRLDSLANAYADLPECGEVAIARYRYMNGQTDATVEQEIAYIDESLKRWGSWQRMNVLRNARRDMTARQFHAFLEHRLWIPNRSQKLMLNDLRAIDQLTIRFYRVKADGDIDLDPENEEQFRKLKPLLTLMPERTLNAPATPQNRKEYELFNDTLELAALPVGVYMMEVESQPKTKVARTLFFISDVRVLMLPLPDNQTRYVTVSATTGRPVSGAQLRLSQRNSDKTVTTLTTNAQGECIYAFKEDQRPNRIFVTTKDDRSCPELSAYGRFTYYGKERITKHITVYTDRAIYRPGQTVHAAAICYENRNGFEHEVMVGKQVTARLYDANNKVVTERQLTTDDFGTVATDFVLPASGLMGRFRVEVDNRSQVFRVEEYKRPTFQVEFPEVKQNYKDGDTLAVRATVHTYSGVPVQGARVSYKVVRRMAFWWISYYRYWQGGNLGIGQQSEQVFAGEALTDDDGSFEVRMPMVLPKSKHPQFYNFVVVADVTDQGGETHQGQLSLPLGNCTSVITIDLPDKVLAEEMPKLKLHLLNAAGNDVDAAMRYQIDGGKWLSAQSNTAVDLPKLKSGRHKLKVECDGKQAEREFVAFSLNDKRPAIETNDWFYVSNGSDESSTHQFPNDGTPVTLQVGASGNVHIIYTLVAGNTIIEQGSTYQKNELINRKLTYKPEYGNGLTLSYAWVRDSKTYTHTVQIKRPLPNKTLKMKWETFRNRLEPGQQEEWTLRIEAPQPSALFPLTSAKNTPLKVQLLATLYDKSIDQLLGYSEKRTWELEPQMWLPMASLRWNYGDWGMTGCSGYKHEGNLKVRELRFSHFDGDCFPYPWVGRNRTMRLRGLNRKTMDGIPEVEGAVLTKASVNAQKPIPVYHVYDAIGIPEDEDEQTSEALQGRIAGLNVAKKETAEPEVKMRENLQETAFFYPQLLADSTGLVSIRFTLPESLTTWRFLGIAHTKDMMHGFLDGEAVAQKDVMIQPNVPRFLRVGDKATVTARVFNMTEHELNATVRMQLIEPESDQVIYDERLTETLPANRQNAVAFQLDASGWGNYSLLVCKMTVTGDSFSDGEQHYLPLLPDREHVTVTVPFTQNEPGVKTVNLATLVPNGSSMGKFTIEYTNNPAWLMIQALPTLGNPNEKNVVCQAASLYANSIGKYILDQNPQAKHVFEMWKSAQPVALQSSLQQNQELKDLLLNETPWVMDADRESELKQRLADFFDENLMQQRHTSAVENLEKLQNSDGSWSWWPGMNGSFFMTVEVSEMLVRLNQMTGQQKDTEQMLDNAFRYMDKEIVALVAKMKKEEKRGIKQAFPTFRALQYLYLSALDGRKPSANVQQAQAYLKNLLKKDVKRQTIYEKAMSAIILNSPLYIKSLKEYTVYREEMGRYYDTQRASYSWRDYRIPTQVAAIEAIQRLAPEDTVTIGEMQRWLLQQKRTQAWDTPINSVDAIYAFLSENEKVKSEKLVAAPRAILKVDGKPLETSQATAGIGYVKTAMPAEGKATFTAEKTSAGTSWGAVYAQFMQSVKKVADQQSGFSVKREIVAQNNRNIQNSQSNQKTLKMGDRVKVRITIVADRDCDFVQVVDKRAACMEPVVQLSGYQNGAYRVTKDNATYYYFDQLPKGTHVIETEYFLDRTGQYGTGICTVGCAYAPEFRATTHAQTIIVE